MYRQFNDYLNNGNTSIFRMWQIKQSELKKSSPTGNTEYTFIKYIMKRIQ